MRKIRHFLLVLCVVALGSGWVSTVFAQTAIDLHTGRVTKASPNENPMSKQRIMARDRALATQDFIAQRLTVASAARTRTYVAPAYESGNKRCVAAEPCQNLLLAQTMARC